MRIIFAGTPDYAVPSLKALVALAPEHQVVGVVTQPDRPLKRSKAPMAPPVKAAALALGIAPEIIFQPKSINLPEQLAQLKNLEPDVLCVVAYGGLLKRDALDLAKKYPLNAHGSLLPAYRGAAPLQAAIMAGDEETGVTIMKMAEKLDNGPVMLQRETPISSTDTAATLHDRMASLSAICFVDAIRMIDEGTECFCEQDESLATYAIKLSKKSGQMNWNGSAESLERFVRAMTPWPGAWTSIQARSAEENSKSLRVRILSAAFDPRQGSREAGGVGESNVTEFENKLTGVAGCAFEVSCESGKLFIQTIQPEGKKAMSVDAFLRGAGRSFVDGAQFGVASV